MYEAEGIGLAANQVDLPLRLFVMNLAGQRGEGEEMVWINPELSQPRGERRKGRGLPQSARSVCTGSPSRTHSDVRVQFAG